MNARLKLAILAQALLDAIDEEDDELIESALLYLQHYPQLIQKLMKSNKRDLSRWRSSVERAMGRPPERKKNVQSVR